MGKPLSESLRAQLDQLVKLNNVLREHADRTFAGASRLARWKDEPTGNAANAATVRATKDKQVALSLGSLQHGTNGTTSLQGTP